MGSGTDTELAATAVLADPVRRALYLHVARQPQDVSRDDAAAAVRIERSLAAFHLDKLVEAGLVDATYRRLSGKSGPGAGRPSKLYRRSAREIEVHVPERRYQLLAHLFAGAIESGGAAARRALLSAARGFGRDLGSEAHAAAGPRPSRDRLLRSATGLLERAGFMPYRDGTGDLRLRNCPFDALAKQHRDLVCGMNVELMDGLVQGLEVGGVRARFEPQDGQCCVALRRASDGRAAAR